MGSVEASKITRHRLAITWHVVIRDKATDEDAPQKLTQALQPFFAARADLRHTTESWTGKLVKQTVSFNTRLDLV